MSFKDLTINDCQSQVACPWQNCSHFLATLRKNPPKRMMSVNRNEDRNVKSKAACVLGRLREIVAETKMRRSAEKLNRKMSVVGIGAPRLEIAQSMKKNRTTNLANIKYVPNCWYEDAIGRGNRMSLVKSVTQKNVLARKKRITRNVAKVKRNSV